MKRNECVLILGYGNPLRGDDALGPQVAEELAVRLGDDPRVTVQAVHQLTLDLAETLANFRFASSLRNLKQT